MLWAFVERKKWRASINANNGLQHVERRLRAASSVNDFSSLLLIFNDQMDLFRETSLRDDLICLDTRIDLSDSLFIGDVQLADFLSGLRPTNALVFLG